MVPRCNETEIDEYLWHFENLRKLELALKQVGPVIAICD